MQKIALLFLSFKVICHPEKCKQRKLKILDAHLIYFSGVSQMHPKLP